MNSVDDYFGRHLRGLMGRPLLDGYESYSMDFLIRFRDLGTGWFLSVVDGAIHELTGPIRGQERDFTVVFDVDTEVFLDIVSAQLSPQKAFFMRRTDIKGNLFEGMKLAKLLALFFQTYPYRETPLDR